MTALPVATDFTGASVTEAQFKTAITDLRSFLEQSLSAVGGGVVGINIAAPDGTLHVHTATAGAVVADSGVDDLVVENSSGGGLSILTPDASTGQIAFGSPADPIGARIFFTQSQTSLVIGTHLANGLMTFETAVGVEAARIDANGAFFIGDNINTDMTVGLTVNQGANDDQILALKSSDVNHAMTGAVEADTYGAFSKAEATSGGLVIQGFKDADGAAGRAITIQGELGEAADTSDIGTSNACIHLRARVTDGGTGVTDVADAGNIMLIENNNSVRLLVKGNGALHITNVIDIAASTGTDVSVAIALADAFDDVALVRAHQRTVYRDMGVAMTKWDESMALDDNVDLLKRLGVLSSQGDFTIVHRMNSLLGGAIWQGHIARSELEQAIAETMPAIAARLEEIRAERKLALAK